MKVIMRMIEKKNMYRLIIRAKDRKKLSSKLDGGKIIGSDEVYPKILKYISNEHFINALCKLFEHCINYDSTYLENSNCNKKVRYI